MYKFPAWVAGMLLPAIAGFWIYEMVQFTISNQPILAGGWLVIGGLTLFILIILARIERMAKGLLLVGLAVMTTLLNSVMVEPMFALINTMDDKSDAVKEALNLPVREWILENSGMNFAQLFDASKQWINAMSSFVNIACAGAGGSIIAVEGDRTSIVRSVSTWTGWRVWKRKTKNVSGCTSTAPVTPDINLLMHILDGKMDRQAEAASELLKLISGLDKQMATLSEQQNRIRWALQLIALVIAVVAGFVLGAVVFGRS